MAACTVLAARLATSAPTLNAMPVSPCKVRVGIKSRGVGPGLSASAVLWWDGDGWRTTEALGPSGPAGQSKPREYCFQPVATQRLRLLGPPERFEKVEVHLCKNGQEYLDRARLDSTDVLGLRAVAGGDPDLGGVASLLLPVAFLKGLAGRADDIEETMLTCDGKLILRTGTGSEQQHRFDRFVAFAVNGRAIGETPEEISRRLIDGWMPGVIYDLQAKGGAAKMTVFTTAQGDESYGDRVHWEFDPPGRAASEISVEVILGNRLTTYAARAGNCTSIASGCGSFPSGRRAPAAAASSRPC
jgi:hypothetical protein